MRSKSNFIIKIQFKHLYQTMLLTTHKKNSSFSYQTSGLLSIRSREVHDSKSQQNQQTKRGSQMSILQKLNSSKFKNILDIDISDKIILHTGPQDSQKKYFVLGQDSHSSSRKIKSNNQPYKYSQLQDKYFIVNPLALKNSQVQSHKNITVSQNPSHHFSQHEKQNIIKKNSSGRRFLNSTESWTQKATPQQPKRKDPVSHHKKSLHQRDPNAPISIHEQLYLQSKKKSIKRSAEQIIENEYFKKVHPFKPLVSQVSEFLAEQKRSKIKEREKFDQEFQEFSQQKDQNTRREKKNKEGRRKKKDMLDIEKQKENEKKQAELKNYTILKQFFFYLSQNEPILSYEHLNSKKLCTLPSACIKLIQPFLEQFYKNKKTKQLSWLQFLSEFNLKVHKRNSFYPLIEKWFWIKYKLRFDSHSKQTFEFDQNTSNIQNQQQSNYRGNQAASFQENISRSKMQRIC